MYAITYVKLSSAEEYDIYSFFLLVGYYLKLNLNNMKIDKKQILICSF